MVEFFEFLDSKDGKSLRIIFRGFWGEAQIAAYQSSLEERGRKQGNGSPKKRVLLDLLHCTVQSQDIIEKMARIIEVYSEKIEDYALVLPESPLVSLQMKRLMSERSAKILNENEAADWLGQQRGS